MSEPLLFAGGIVAGYEPGLPIVRGASLAVKAGEILAVLGPNGAGKSTLIKAIAGLVPISEGEVRLEGREIRGAAAHRMVGLGLALVPQTENVFATMSIAENLAIAGHVLPAGVRQEQTAAVLALFPDLAERPSLLAGRLSGGQRQMLAIARALMVRPRVLMLDEPSAGLSPKLTQVVFSKLAEIRQTGLAIVLVEQNVRAALALADRAIILVEGQNRHEGPAGTLRDDPHLGALYLGAAPERAVS